MKLVTLTDPNSAAAEAYRTLRTNLIFASLEQPLQTLLVTSTSEEDGKTAALANLAVAFAQSGRKTIVVEGDLRHPAIPETFEVSASIGLTTMLSGNSNDVPLVKTNHENLWLLPAGPLNANPADLLSSRRLEEVIATLKAQADHILFSAPPVLAVSDAALLAAKLDGTLLVLNAGHTRRDHAQRAKDLLEKIKVRVVGAVLTNSQE